MVANYYFSQQIRCQKTTKTPDKTSMQMIKQKYKMHVIMKYLQMLYLFTWQVF